VHAHAWGSTTVCMVLATTTRIQSTFQIGCTAFRLLLLITHCSFLTVQVLRSGQPAAATTAAGHSRSPTSPVRTSSACSLIYRQTFNRSPCCQQHFTPRVSYHHCLDSNCRSSCSYCFSTDTSHSHCTTSSNSRCTRAASAAFKPQLGLSESWQGSSCC
jgi:hypothetical protein